VALPDDYLEAWKTLKAEKDLEDLNRDVDDGDQTPLYCESDDVIEGCC